MYNENGIRTKIDILGLSPLDILVVGATGSGKSSTINCLLGYEVAIVGEGVNPQTSRIEHYKIKDILRFWDTPGIGDSTIKDEEYLNLIKEKVYAKVRTTSSRIVNLIDMVLIIINGSSRDLSSIFKIIDYLSSHISSSRIIFGINYIDCAMSGKYWNYDKNFPEQKLLNFIFEKEKSLIDRLKDHIGINDDSLVSYSAKYGYNINGLIDIIIKNFPQFPRCTLK